MATSDLARLSKVVLAFAFAGPAAAARESGVQILDRVAASTPSLKKILNSVQRQFQQIINTGEYISADQEGVWLALETIFEHHALTATDLLDQQLNAQRATLELLNRGESHAKGLSSGGRIMLEQAALAVYTAVLEKPELVGSIDVAFKARMLERLDTLTSESTRQRIDASESDKARRRALPLDAAVTTTDISASPAQRVQARSASVPFVDHHSQLRSLQSWFDDTGTNFSVAIIGGRGGSGKTRLATELCKATPAGWIHGFLRSPRDTSLESLKLLSEWPENRLIVVDYAETKIAQLDQLLPQLKDSADKDRRVRVLLLVRSAPGSGPDRWRYALHSGASDMLTNLLAASTILELKNVANSDRISVFQAAFRIFMEDLPKSSSVQDQAGPIESSVANDAAESIRSDAFNTPLMLVIAAFLFALGEAIPDSREKLLKQLLAHEQRHWNTVTGNPSPPLGADGELQRRVIGLATLLGGFEDETASAGRLRLLPDLEDCNNAGRGQWARWGHFLYSFGPHWWNPLEPDLLGEHLVAECLGTSLPPIVAGVLKTRDAAAIESCLNVVNRTIASYPYLTPQVQSVVNQQLELLVELAMEQANSIGSITGWTGSSIPNAVANLVGSCPNLDADTINAVLKHFTDHNVILNSTAVALHVHRVAAYRLLALDGTEQATAQLAEAMSDLSAHLGDAGRRSEALTIALESIDLGRSLKRTEPSVQRQLASALMNGAVHLQSVGRNEESLDYIDEAIGIYRDVVENTLQIRLDLAKALNNKSTVLYDLGRTSDAQSAIGEANAIYATLDANEPKVYQANIAKALNNSAGYLLSNGDAEGALDKTLQAISIYEVLVDSNAGAWGPNLASSESNLAAIYHQLGRMPESASAAERAVQNYRQLVLANSLAWKHELARALHNAAVAFAETNRSTEAFAAAEEAAQLYRDLYAAHPDRWLPNLAGSLIVLSSRLGSQGRFEDAFQVAIEARRLFESAPAPNSGQWEAEYVQAVYNCNHWQARLRHQGN